MVNNLRLAFFAVIFALILFFTGCSPSPDLGINEFRKQGKFPTTVDLPVAFIATEWSGKSRIRASGWLVDGANGVLMSAKHFSDTFMGDIIELGASECKVFLSGRVYTCIIVKVQSTRDAVLLKLLDFVSPSELPEPYKISKKELATGDKVKIQGFHFHSREITESNKKDGINDLIIPVLESFYDLRAANPSNQSEVVFEDIKGVIVKPDPDSTINDPFLDGEQKKTILEFENNLYIKVRTDRDHKFSFGGLSGGVALNSRNEAVGVITAQDIFRFEYGKRSMFFGPHGEVIVVPRKQLFDTIYVTPIKSVMDLVIAARDMR